MTTTPEILPVFRLVLSDFTELSADDIRAALGRLYTAEEITDAMEQMVRDGYAEKVGTGWRKARHK